MRNGTYSRQQIRANNGSDFSKIASRQIIQQHRFLLNQMKKNADLEGRLPEKEDSQEKNEQPPLSQFQLSLKGPKYARIRIDNIINMDTSSDNYGPVRGNR